MSNSNYKFIFGTLECKLFLMDWYLLFLDNPNNLINQNKTLLYRKILQIQTHHQQIIKITSPEIKNKIKIVYRLGFLKDTVIASQIDEILIHTFLQVTIPFVPAYFLRFNSFTTLIFSNIWSKNHQLWPNFSSNFWPISSPLCNFLRNFSLWQNLWARFLSKLMLQECLLITI